MRNLAEARGREEGQKTRKTRRKPGKTREGEMRQKKLFNRKRDLRGRPREMEEPRTISIQFENAMLEELDEKVWRMGKSRSDFIRELVGKALSKKGEG